MSERQTITTLSGAPLDGTCKLTADQLKTSTNNTIQFPSDGGMLATIDAVAAATGDSTLTLSKYSSEKVSMPHKTI